MLLSIIFKKWPKLATTFHVLSYTVTLRYRLRVTSDEQLLNHLESRSDFAILRENQCQGQGQIVYLQMTHMKDF